MEFAHAGFGVWGDLTVRVEADAFDACPELGFGRLDFLARPLSHKEAPADAADQDRCRGFAATAPRLPGCVGRAGRESLEIAAHQLRYPALRHVAGEGHRPRLRVDRKD